MYGKHDGYGAKMGVGREQDGVYELIELESFQRVTVISQTDTSQKSWEMAVDKMPGMLHWPSLRSEFKTFLHIQAKKSGSCHSADTQWTQ